MDANLTLVNTEVHASHIVEAVRPPAQSPEWGNLLEEIGFLPGEIVTVMARGMIGGDPLVVRVGSSTFALRRAEAACIVVRARHHAQSPAIGIAHRQPSN